MDTKGTVYVADSGTGAIRMIRAGGDVVPFVGRVPGCSLPSPWISKGLEPFASIRGMALDPDSETLYATCGDSIIAFDQRGNMVTALGNRAWSGFEAFLEYRDRPGKMPCLHQPGNLQVRPGWLFIADTGNHAIRAFSLRSGSLDTLAGSPGQATTRTGPLKLFNPSLPPEACAALAAPSAMACDGAGRCLVASGDGLYALDLGMLLRPAGDRP